MLTRLLSAGLMAGVIAGLCVAGLQQVTTTPLILKAETYENKTAPAAEHHSTLRNFNGAPILLAHSVTDAAPAEVEEWAPEDGLQRSLLTSTATIGAAIGFGFMLLAVMLASGATINASTGALWGAAGFVVTGLAPGLGLSPELPGSVSAELLSRQAWWVSTAAATAIGLWMIWRARSIGSVFGAIALMAIPHVIGAPHPHEFGSTVPAELASHFTSTSLSVHAILWVLVGALGGYFWDRQSPSTLPPEAA